MDHSALLLSLSFLLLLIQWNLQFAEKNPIGNQLATDKKIINETIMMVFLDAIKLVEYSNYQQIDNVHVLYYDVLFQPCYVAYTNISVFLPWCYTTNQKSAIALAIWNLNELERWQVMSEKVWYKLQPKIIQYYVTKFEIEKRERKFEHNATILKNYNATMHASIKYECGLQG